MKLLIDDVNYHDFNKSDKKTDISTKNTNFAACLLSGFVVELP